MSLQQSTSADNGRHPELRIELLQMMEADQHIRTVISEKYAPGATISEDDFTRWADIDKANTTRLKSIIQVYGWPGRSLVGETGALAAWLLAQHADHDVEFQKQCLMLLQHAVAEHDANPQHLAYLVDRVRLAEGSPQVYGTQVHRTDTGAFIPAPLEDPETVDQRRAALGLEPIATYLASFDR
jgi:hypothetical protein